jgi:hypothetical protein
MVMGVKLADWVTETREQIASLPGVKVTTMGEKVTMTEASRRLGMSISGMSRMVERMKIQTSHELVLSANDRPRRVMAKLLDWDELVARRPENQDLLTTQQASELLGTCPNTVIARAKHYGVVVLANPFRVQQTLIRRDDLERMRKSPKKMYPDEETHKRCTKCHQRKELSEFHGQKKKYPHCKQCHRVLVSNWQMANPEKAKEIRNRAKRAHYQRQKLIKEQLRG